MPGDVFGRLNVSGEGGSSRCVVAGGLLLKVLQCTGQPPTVKNCLVPVGFPRGSVVKNAAAGAKATGDTGSIPESGRPLGGGNNNPLQYSCQENVMDRRAWRATGHGIAKSQTRLHD